MSLPQPLEFGWKMKPVESAQTGLKHLNDGRMELTIVHDLLKGISPQMLYWWFSNIGGEMEYRGKVYNRYRVWHPHDHIHWVLVKAGPSGKAEAGSVFHIVEAFGRNPRHAIDVKEVVEKLDETGIRLSSRQGGFEVSNLEHTFTPVRGGTLYRSRLLIGAEHPLVRGLFNHLVRPLVFPEAMGRAWLRHNIEEVGNFEFFLPELYGSAHLTVTTQSATITGDI